MYENMRPIASDIIALLVWGRAQLDFIEGDFAVKKLLVRFN